MELYTNNYLLFGGFKMNNEEYEILKILSNSEKYICNIKVYMVVNVKEKTKINHDYNKYSISTEFFSDSECFS